MSWRTASKVKWLRALTGVSEDEPLATSNSFGIGGPAEFFVEMGKPQAIEEVLDGAAERGIPYMLLGAGTNLLIADAGIEGLVVRVVNREVHIEGRQIHAGAGLKMMRLARIAADAGLVGFEFAIGVPGTVGGAVYQNAGCWGKELREVLVEVEGYMPGKGHRTWNPVDLHFRYRTSALRDGALKGGLVIEAKIQLERGDGEAAKALMAKLTKERNETQPIKTKNCGSVFQNPPGDSAGRLVQAAGLKGAREGMAVVSTLHGNFIVNEGGATAADVKRLIERIQTEVRRRFNIELATEVEMVGKFKK
ncbi:MAG TPA: UDP-N-acetylmuramate dehydrogenase [Candidatus Eisenbacteria bacterium]|nr:UDP-N-acetylmuramate dehydrogenase [Candidatus Eisenbacteria bacterium]